MPSAIKQRIVAELAQRIRAMPHALLVDFTGLGAGKADELRGVLDEHGARMLVVKNSLAVLALRQLDLPEVADLVNGPTALIAGGEDPVALAKAVREWGRKERLLTVRGGLVEGQALPAAAVERLATLPPLPVLQAQAVGAIAAPLTGLVGVLQGVLRSLAGVVQAIAEKKESA